VCSARARNTARGGACAPLRTAWFRLRACLKIRKGAVFSPQAGWRGATKENIPCGSSTEEQRSQPACGAKTLRAAGLLTVGFVGSAPYSPLRGCSDLAASPTVKIPRRSALPNFQTGSSTEARCRDCLQRAHRARASAAFEVRAVEEG
jgi:hypothetical protein